MVEPILNPVRVYIGIGSNLDTPLQHVQNAIKELTHLALDNNLQASSIYQSKPLAGMKQPDYFNAVATFRTNLQAHDLLDKLQAIEQQHGRIRTGEHWGPRTLDLDLILFGNEQINDDRLTVPHAGMLERNFVLIPLSELDPELRLPDNSALKYWLEQSSSEGIIKIE